MISMREKHFQHRYCVNNKRVTDIVYSYPSELETPFYYWNPKTICKTNDYKLGLSIHNGLPKKQKKVVGVFE